MRIIIITLALLLPACSADITTSTQQQQYKTVCINGVEYFKQGTRVDSVVYTSGGSVKLCPIYGYE